MVSTSARAEKLIADIEAKATIRGLEHSISVLQTELKKVRAGKPADGGDGPILELTPPSHRLNGIGRKKRAVVGVAAEELDKILRSGDQDWYTAADLADRLGFDSFGQTTARVTSLYLTWHDKKKWTRSKDCRSETDDKQVWWYATKD